MTSLQRFLADVDKANDKARAGGIPGLKRVMKGAQDGTAILILEHESLPKDTRIYAHAYNLAEYPDYNQFGLSTDNSKAPKQLIDSISKINYLFGMSVYEMASHVADVLLNDSGDGNAGDDADDDDADVEEDEEDDWGTEYGDGDDDDFDGEAFGLNTAPKLRPLGAVFLQNTQLLKRLKKDLKEVHNAGYNVGIIGHFARTFTSGIVSLSIRASKLGLSDEALEAWDLTEDEFAVLLIRFENYDTLEEVLEKSVTNTRMSFRIGKCASFKPSEQQAVSAFPGLASHLLEADDLIKTHARATDPEAESEPFEKMFISNSLDQFMDEQFVPLLRLRRLNGYGWEEANEAYHSMEHSGANINISTKPAGDPMDIDEIRPEQPRVLAGDHFEEGQQGQELSLPLIAMQFAMRYFVKCTEYCLRCHRRLKKGFEALRPYVCENPLCLFQYMTMGFGPSIEHEILTEPYVVDLLVSLCYVAVQGHQATHHYSVMQPPVSSGSANDPDTVPLPIREVPVGLQMKIPKLQFFTNPQISSSMPHLILVENTLEFKDPQEIDGLFPGQWIACQVRNRPGPILHARINTINHSTKTVDIIRMAYSACRQSGLLSSLTVDMSTGGGNINASLTSRIEVLVFPYDTDFDDFPSSCKGEAIRIILETLPSIFAIEEWLNSQPWHTVKNMDKVSPAAASLLQWIVSSNRSCIFQVDRGRFFDSGLPLQDLTKPAGRGRNREDERVQGMDGWMQFRFAQGSPDKELRFNRALQEIARQKQTKKQEGTPATIFAWHGSRLANWHSIVRSGLDFRDTLNGRAFGHGVYFSRDASTSIGYSQGSLYHAGCWPNSVLQFTSCLSLNEIINAPERFVSSNPHYVISQLDWHQCRYLFVMPKQKPPQPLASPSTQTRVPGDFLSQPPGLEVLDRERKPIGIPASAIPASRTVDIDREVDKTANRLKRARPFQNSSDNEEIDDARCLNNESDAESSEDHSPPFKKVIPRPDATESRPLTPMSIWELRTDFEPGALDLDTLSRLEPPSFATPIATKALSGELKKLQQVQANTPLHELGWYVDFDLVNNLFQWIVELHSFDPSLPLAQDMKKAGCKSIVLELRFPRDYPFNPPFVRVIRPYFLPFQQGGGGHVTMGGAMCMELLTSNGWMPTFSMENILLQVRMALCSTDPKPARLSSTMRDYGLAEAISAFERAARTHSWTIPADFLLTANGK